MTEEEMLALVSKAIDTYDQARADNKAKRLAAYKKARSEQSRANAIARNQYSEAVKNAVQRMKISIDDLAVLLRRRSESDNDKR